MTMRYGDPGPLGKQIADLDPVIVDRDGNEIAKMTDHEQALFDKLLKGKQVKADHPITCLNPEEWFEPVTVQITDERRIFVRGVNTCWWSLRMCEVRDAAPRT